MIWMLLDTFVHLKWCHSNFLLSGCIAVTTCLRLFSSFSFHLISKKLTNKKKPSISAFSKNFWFVKENNRLCFLYKTTPGHFNWEDNGTFVCWSLSVFSFSRAWKLGLKNKIELNHCVVEKNKARKNKKLFLKLSKIRKKVACKSANSFSRCCCKCIKCQPIPNWVFDREKHCRKAWHLFYFLF